MGHVLCLHTHESALRLSALYSRCVQVSANEQEWLCQCRLCEVTKKPPLCPFCRNFIEGFHALQLTD